MQPSSLQEPSSLLAMGRKLNAAESVQPVKTTGHEPSSKVADGSKSMLVGSLQPPMAHDPSSTTANER